MRKLASIRKIKEIKEHPNADNLELAMVDGWQVVVKKGEFQTGDKCVYFEIDSFLPIQPEFEFLRKGCYKKLPDGTEGFRLRTIRLRKERSQGLALPVSTFGFEELGVGTDLTDKLNVIKYEPPVPVSLSGKVKGNFPSKIPKTDEERCISGDTLIHTEDGEMTIKSICENGYRGKVYSYNEFTGESELNGIIGHNIMKNDNDWYEIILENDVSLVVTGNHKIYLPKLMCYRRTDQLEMSDDVLFFRKYINMKIKSINKIDYASKRYDILVDKVSNFYANGILVHNCQNIGENTLHRFMFGDIHLDVREKLDGTSFTAYLLDGEFGVCSRNWDLERDENNTYWKVALKLGLEEKMREFSEDMQIKEFAIQGELIGPGIQKNRYALSELDVYFFTFYNVDIGERDQLSLQIFTRENGLKQVPLIVNTALVSEHEFFNYTIEDWLNYAEGASTLNKRTEREGIIVRDIAENSFSFKVISNKFLDNE